MGLLWIYPHVSPGKVLEHYPTSVASLALQGIQQCLSAFGQHPSVLVVPYTAHQVKVLFGTLDDWAILTCIFEGLIDNHYPKHLLLTFFKAHPVVFPRMTAADPIPGAALVFTDGSKTGRGAYKILGQEPIVIHSKHTSP